MGSFNIFKKKPAKKEQTHYTKTNLSGEPLNKLVNGELPFGWITYSKSFIKPRDAKVGEYMQKIDCSSIDSEIKGLTQLLEYCNSYRKECAKKGECYLYYYDWMYGKNENSGLLEHSNRLKYLKNNYLDLKSLENKRKQLNTTLYEFLKNNSGILQKDIYKSFSPELKADIQSLLYYWNKEGRITRKKHGNTYSIQVI